MSASFNCGAIFDRETFLFPTWVTVPNLVALGQTMRA